MARSAPSELDEDSECRLRVGDRIAEHPALPGLAPLVEHLFRQIAVTA